VPDDRWADYVDQLDRGLDELDAELDRAAGRTGAGPDASEVLTIRLTGLELQGWKLRFDGATGGLDHVRSSLAAAEAELDRYEAECDTGSARTADAVDRSVADLRRAAEAAG
jgi:hypothetical protein